MDSDELVGRDDVLGALSAALAAGREAGTAILLVGEPGIGKSACLQAAQRLATAEGRLVLDTAGTEAETHLPYAGLQRLLRPVLEATPRLPDAQRAALLAALGLHRGKIGDGLLVCLAVMSLLGQAATDRSVVIAADDLHWLDRPTRDVLAFVARRLEPHAIVVIAASSAPRDVFALGDACRELRLGRLDRAAAHRLVASRAPGLERAQRTWVVDQAVGNPLALLELGRTAASIDGAPGDAVRATWSVPPALQRAFGGPVQHLTEPARTAMLVAAVAPEAGLQQILAATSQLCGTDVTAAVLETSQALGLLRVDETTVQFAHPLSRAVVVQGESISRRQAAHRALGDVTSLSAHRRAWHRALGTAAHDDDVATEMEATVPDSIRRGDPMAAIAALERAAQLSRAPAERGRRLLLASRHAARVGRPDLVERLLAAATECTLSDFDRARADLLREDLDGVVIADSTRVIQLCRAATRAAAAGEMALALELGDVAVRRRCAAPVDAVALSQLTALASSLADSCDDAPATAVLALADPVGNGRAVLAVLAAAEEVTPSDGDELTAYAVAARAVGHYSAAAWFFDRAEIALRAGGLIGPLARNLSVAADLRLDLAEWDRAVAALSGFEALSTASMSRSHRASALLTRAKLAALRDDVAAALELVSAAEHSGMVRSGSRGLARAQIVRGLAAISAGKHADAFEALSRVFDPEDPTHHFREQFDAVTYLAEAAAHTGRHGAVRDTIERMRRTAERSGSPALLTHLAYADAVLADDDEAEPAFLAALAADGSGSPWHRARLQLAYGRWLRRQYRVTQSRAPLQEALAVFGRLGATRWATEAQAELEAAGVALAAAPAGAAATVLSTQELKIAQLAAQGLTNREIAAQLYLSPRTVSSHLYRIFPKLAISTRAQIAGRLAGDPVLDPAVGPRPR